MAYTAQSNLGLAVQGMLERLAALQMLVWPDVKNAVPYPLHEQNSWPYWTNSFEGLSPNIPVGDRRAVGFAFDVEMHLALGQVASLYDAQMQIDALLMSADVVAWFTARPRLADPSADDVTLHTPPRWIAPSGITVRAGRLNFAPNDTNTYDVFVLFPLTVPIHVGVE